MNKPVDRLKSLTELNPETTHSDISIDLRAKTNYVPVMLVVSAIIFIAIFMYMTDHMTSAGPGPGPLSYAVPRFNADATHVQGNYKKYPPLLGQERHGNIWTSHRVDTDARINEEINVYSPVKSGYNSRIWETPFYPPQHLYRNTIQTIAIIHPHAAMKKETVPVKEFFRQDRNLVKFR